MSIVLNKITDYKVNDIMIDFDWDDEGESGTIIAVPDAEHDTFEIAWHDGQRTQETLETMAHWSHVVVRPTSVPCTFNTPCPSAGHVTADSAPADYSDGYGNAYSKGE